MSFDHTKVVLATIESHFHRLATEVYTLIKADTENQVIGSFSDSGDIHYGVLASKSAKTAFVDIYVEDTKGVSTYFRASINTRDNRLNRETFSVPTQSNPLNLLRFESFIGALDFSASIGANPFEVEKEAEPVIVEYAVTGVSAFSYEIDNGDNHTFELNNTPTTPVKWMSSNPSIASIDQDTGELTAHRGGTTNITVGPFTDGKQEYISFTVASNEPINYTLDKTTIGEFVGKRFKIPAVPAAPLGNDVWTSNDTDIATVDFYGNVMITGVGTTTITGLGLTLTVVGKEDVTPPGPEPEPEAIDLNLVISSANPYSEYVVISANHPNKAQLLIDYAGSIVEVPWDFDFKMSTDFLTATEPDNLRIALYEEVAEGARRRRYPLLGSYWGSDEERNRNWNEEGAFSLYRERPEGYNSGEVDHIGFNEMRFKLDSGVQEGDPDFVIELKVRRNVTGAPAWEPKQVAYVDPMLLTPGTPEQITYGISGDHFVIFKTTDSNHIDVNETGEVSFKTSKSGYEVQVWEYESMDYTPVSITYNLTPSTTTQFNSEDEVYYTSDVGYITTEGGSNSGAIYWSNNEFDNVNNVDGALAFIAADMGETELTTRRVHGYVPGVGYFYKDIGLYPLGQTFTPIQPTGAIPVFESFALEFSPRLPNNITVDNVTVTGHGDSNGNPFGILEGSWPVKVFSNNSGFERTVNFSLTGGNTNIPVTSYNFVLTSTSPSVENAPKAIPEFYDIELGVPTELTTNYDTLDIDHDYYVETLHLNGSKLTNDGNNVTANASFGASDYTDGAYFRFEPCTTPANARIVAHPPVNTTNNSAVHGVVNYPNGVIAIEGQALEFPWVNPVGSGSPLLVMGLRDSNLYPERISDTSIRVSYSGFNINDRLAEVVAYTVVDGDTPAVDKIEVRLVATNAVWAANNSSMAVSDTLALRELFTTTYNTVNVEGAPLATGFNATGFDTDVITITDGVITAVGAGETTFTVETTHPIASSNISGGSFSVTITVLA